MGVKMTTAWSCTSMSPICLNGMLPRHGSNLPRDTLYCIILTSFSVKSIYNVDTCGHGHKYTV
jgi:hypothetical protein